MSILKAYDDNEWEAKRDMHTLIDAHKIRSDPKRHRKALKHSAAIKAERRKNLKDSQDDVKATDAAIAASRKPG